MKCINEEMIQKFIDGETDAKETARIEEHLENCPFCAGRVEEQRAFANHIKSTMGHWSANPVPIPEFKVRNLSKRRFIIKNKYYMYAASVAASIAFLILFLFPKENKANEYQMIYCIDGDFNSNRPYSQQEMTIKIIDKNGRIIDLADGL
jgi:hypothetical protein